MNLKITSIIERCILKEIKNDNWVEIKGNLLNNFIEIDLFTSIENYEPCQKKLYLSRPKMREIIRKNIECLYKIFKELDYGKYEPKEGYNITFNEINELIENLVEIMVQKQQNFIYLK